MDREVNQEDGEELIDGFRIFRMIDIVANTANNVMHHKC